MECPHGLDSPEWCSICKERSPEGKAAKRRARNRESFEGGTRAQYPGTCAECGDRIEAGDRIVFAVRAGVDGWVHEECS